PGQVDFVPDYYYTFPTQDLFLADRATGTTVLVSHQAGLPTTTAMTDTGSFAISADGSGIAFSNVGTHLVAGQTGSGLNVFLYDRLSGESTLVSHADGAAAQGVGGVVLLAISG